MNSDLIRVFIGHDRRIPVCFSVMAHSINSRASRPVSITPVALSQLGHVFKREWHPLQSTEFSFTRFLVPWLCNYSGWAIFTDNDMIVRDDIAKLWDLRDDKYAVMVVKHDQLANDSVKFLNAPQTKYEKKNWTSVMLINTAKCKALTPDYVNTASGLELHQFKWLESESLIGNLPPEWGHLVGENQPNPNAKLVHYTLGGPYYNEFIDCEFSDEWFLEKENMLYCAQLEKSK
ncbi:glycosyltransferase [Leptospira yanagawae]|uniref:Glycosyltransferase n=1 Tax=Leptospira yanagawae TaxID=293069 RepID=A0ABY2LWT9_9LEPT|nr:glycosyltransferase [Leptospira yanagawae]TGL16969.1 glycosyltransferase [Leptospira yanagawae]